LLTSLEFVTSVAYIQIVAHIQISLDHGLTVSEIPSNRITCESLNTLGAEYVIPHYVNPDIDVNVIVRVCSLVVEHQHSSVVRMSVFGW